MLIFANLLAEKPGAVDRVIAAVAGAVAAGRIPERMIEESNTLIRTAREGLATTAAAEAAGALPPEAPACPEPRAAVPVGAAAPG